MSSNNSAFALTDFFSRLFRNFPKLLLTNLFFAVPTAVFFGLFYFINTAFSINSYFILFLTIIPVFPFYAGVVQVTSHMVRDDKAIDVRSNFFAGLKENFLCFLVHGIIMYAAVVFSYFSISLYTKLGEENGVFYMLLVVSIIICVFFLFVFYYVPPMTVTFDISMKNIYKNSALMSFGELKHNLAATFGIFVLFLLCATVLMCCYYPVLIVIVTASLSLLIVPSVMSFIINSSVYMPMYNMISCKDKRSSEINGKINEAANTLQGKNINADSLADDFTEIDIDEFGDADEYIFYNGKMIKRGVLLKMKNSSKDDKGE